MRRFAFHYHFDTTMELRLLEEPYDRGRIRFNMLIATSKSVRWRLNRSGKATRVYD